MIRAHVLICGGTGCTSSGSKTLQEAFNQSLADFGLTEEIKMVQTGCFGLCALGPIVIVYPDGTFYSRVTPDDVKKAAVPSLSHRLVLSSSAKIKKDADKNIVADILQQVAAPTESVLGWSGK